MVSAQLALRSFEEASSNFTRCVTSGQELKNFRLQTIGTVGLAGSHSLKLSHNDAADRYTKAMTLWMTLGDEREEAKACRGSQTSYRS